MRMFRQCVKQLSLDHNYGKQNVYSNYVISQSVSLCCISMCVPIVCVCVWVGGTAVFAQSQRGHLDTPPKFFRAMATRVNALATAFPVLNMGCFLASRDNRVTTGATCIG